MSSAVRRLAIIQQHLLLSSQQPFCRTTADANVRSHSTAAQLHMQGKQPKIAFIGAGQMATALAHGFITANVTAPSNIIASDVFANQRESFTINTGARTTDSNSECVRNADIVFLSVKPQVLIPVIKELREAITPQHLIVSIAAGVSIETLESTFEDRRIIRVMPNTPCLIGKSASAFSLGSKATSEDARTVEMLLSAVGLAIQVPERLLDAVTGLSGSGPAYVYQFIEALSDGGVRAGLPRDVASKLAAQTVLGAAQMVIETREHPAMLKDKVASPGGTTIAGLHALEKGGLRAAVIDAVVAATERSAELGK